MSGSNLKKIISNINEKLARAAYAPVLLDLYRYLPDAKKRREGSAAEKIAHILEESKYLISLTDSKGYFVCVNSQWIDNFGWSFEDFTKNSFFEFIHPDDVDKSLNAMEDISIFGDNIEAYNTFENRYKTKSGEYKIVKWRIHNEYDIKRQLFTSIAEIEEA